MLTKIKSVCWIIGKRIIPYLGISKLSFENEISEKMPNATSNSTDIKQVIILIKSLNMRKGKMIAQGCHASLGSYLKIQNTKIAQKWYKEGQKKIVLSVNTESELLEIQRQCIDRNINCELIIDAGHTEFNGIPTITALGIGPVESTVIDSITKQEHLKLL